MVLSIYSKQHILNLYWKGYKISSIVDSAWYLSKVFANSSNTTTNMELLLEILDLDCHSAANRANYAGR